MFKLDPKLDFINHRSNILLVGATRSGKSMLLNNILWKYYLELIDINNIYIFSKTIKIDLAYRDLILFILNNTTKKV